MKTAENQEAGYRQWRSPEPRCVFLLVHGLGTHSGRWEAAADFFLKKGVASYAVELRGIGPAAKPGARPESFDSCYDKILLLRKIAAKDNPGKKIFLIGESLGAITSFLLCASRPGLFSGLVCISPAFAARYKLPFLDSVRIAASLFYNPQKLFSLPFNSEMCTRDTDYRHRLDQDPLEYRTASSKLILGILFAQARAKAVKKILTPVLFLIAGEDKIVDPSAAAAVFRGLAAEDKTLVEFPGMYHALSIDLGKERVFEGILKWIEERVG